MCILAAPPGGKPGADGQNAEVLKNFFNSLLAKKGGAAAGDKKGTPPAAGGSYCVHVCGVGGIGATLVLQLWNC